MTTKREPTPWAATAAAVRRDIKANRAAYGIPDDITVKVTSSSFAGGASVDVTLSAPTTSWAWRTATDADERGPIRAGDAILTNEVRAAGERLATVIEEHRTAGYIWGGVDYNGTCIGSVARQGWQPGQD